MTTQSITKVFALRKSLLQQKVVRDFAAVVGTELALRPVQILKEFFVTKYLGPADYGLLKSIELIQMLNKYGTLGFKPAAAREIGHALGCKDFKQANIVRNTAYSSEFVLAFLLFLAGCTISLFFESGQVSILVILASASLLALKVEGILITESSVQKRFMLTSKISFIASLSACILVIITVPYWRIYAVILMNFVTAVIAILFYLKQLRFPYRFNIEKQEFKSLLGISIPLMAVTLSQGAMKYAERILIVSFIGKVALGFYGFAFMMVNQFEVLFKAAMKVRAQDIYEALGKNEFARVNRIVFRETVVLLAGAILVIPIVWQLLEIFIPVLLPKWVDGIKYAQLSLFMLPVLILPNYHIIVLQSAKINKQKLFPVFQTGVAVYLVIASVLMYQFNLFSLSRFILTNLIGHLLLSFAYLVSYKLFFYNKYLRDV